MKMRMMVMAIVLLLICAGCQRVQPPTSHLSEPGPTLAPTATPYTPIAPTQARAFMRGERSANPSGPDPLTPCRQWQSESHGTCSPTCIRQG